MGIEHSDKDPIPVTNNDPNDGDYADLVHLFREIWGDDSDSQCNLYDYTDFDLYDTGYLHDHD